MGAGTGTMRVLRRDRGSVGALAEQLERAQRIRAEHLEENRAATAKA